MSWTFKSNTYQGRYMQLSISEKIDAKNNRSKLTWTLTSTGGTSSYYTIGETTITINGEQVYHKDRTYYDAYVFPAAKGSTSGTAYVAHRADGKKSITVSFKTRVYTWEPAEYGDTITLTAIDRAAPTISHSVSNITSSGFKISATSSNTADKWEYSLDAGSTYTQFSTAKGLSASVDVSGLSPNTTYNVKVRARREYNQVSGASASSAVKTLGASIINSINNFSADTSAPSIIFSTTVYDSNYYHKFTVKNGNTTIFAVSLGKITAGNITKTIYLTSAQRLAILNAMPNAKSLTLTCVLDTYSDSAYSTRIGSASSKTCTAATSAENSAPEFTEFSCYDSNPISVEATGDDSVFVQNYSTVGIRCTAGVAKNGASITSYTASIGSVSGSSINTQFELSEISSYGNLKITVSCVDSRGYATTLKKTVKVLRYERPKVSSFSLRRRNEIDALVQLSFSGTISSLKADGTTETNSLFLCNYRYKKTSDDEYGNPVSILASVSSSGTSFSFASLELLELDAESSYDFRLTIEDMLKESTVLIIDDILKPGTPVVSLRKRSLFRNFSRVGINNPNPSEALDVVGNGKFSGGISLGDPLPKTSGGTGSNVVYESIELEAAGINSAKISCRKIPYLGMYFINISGALDAALAAGTALTLASIPSEHRPSTTYALPAYFSSGSVGVMARINSSGNVEIRATGAKAAGDHIYVSGWWIK